MMMKPLTNKQETRLINYLDDQLLTLSNHYQTRTSNNSALSTLSEYLQAILTLQSVILPIPPIKPSSSLRISYLLNLTSLLSEAFNGYSIPEASLNIIWSTLRTFDQSWVKVLRGRVWNGEEGDSTLGREGGRDRDTQITGTDLVRLEGIIGEIITVLGEVLGTVKIRKAVALDGEMLEPKLDVVDEEQDLDTPSLVSQSDNDEPVEISTSDDNMNAVDERDSDDDEFEEVEIATSNLEEESYNIQVPRRPPVSIDVEVFDLPIRRGFDPDEEFINEFSDEEDFDRIEEDSTDEFVEEEMENVFRETLAVLVEFRRGDDRAS